MSVLPEVLSANTTYASEFGDRADLALPPARRFAILTCMDARLDPAKYAGLAEGDAHVIRNAGGRASDDALRSLVISYKLLGTREFFVVHHTDCGMEFFTERPACADLLASSLETAELGPDGFRDVGDGPGLAEAGYIDWLTIADQAAERGGRRPPHPRPPARPALASRSTATSTTSAAGGSSRSRRRPARARPRPRPSSPDGPKNREARALGPGFMAGGGRSYPHLRGRHLSTG